LADQADTRDSRRVIRAVTGRTRRCDQAIRVGRIRKATEFYDAAVLVEDTAPNACTDLFIDAGIAAADVICCSRLNLYATGENHSEAVLLLEKAEPAVAKYLRTLLNLKSKVAYTHQSVTAGERKKAGRAAGKLVETAVRVAKPSTGLDR
jgi:hypothetical protein